MWKAEVEQFNGSSGSAGNKAQDSQMPVPGSDTLFFAAFSSEWVSPPLI